MRAGSLREAVTPSCCSAAASTRHCGHANPVASSPGRRPSNATASEHRTSNRPLGSGRRHPISGLFRQSQLAEVMQRASSQSVPLQSQHTEQSLLRLEALAQLMDGAFVIPGTNLRVGLDAIVGLVPIAGDLIASIVSSYMIWEARQLGASRWLLARMIANTTIDTLFGMVPVVGDAFDVLFRANIKNLALLRRHLEKRGRLGGNRIIEGEAVRLN